MKIGFDISPLTTGHKTRGVGFYTKNLLLSLEKIPDLEIRKFSEKDKVKDVDLIHYPYFDLFQNTLPVIKRYPTIVTIHDLIPLVFPEHFPPGVKGTINNFLQRMSLVNVSAIIADSQSSKNDIKNIFKIDQEKIHVVYLAPSPNFHIVKDKKGLEEIKHKYNLPNIFALYTGNVNWNKNIVNIAESCLQVGIHLVVVGKSFESKENLDHPEMRSYKEFLNIISRTDLVDILGFVSDEELVAITNMATVLLLPSHYEGFGLPILEAQACGIPVIAGNNSSMKEVGGDGALYTDDKSIDDISEKIEIIMNNKTLKEDLKTKGLENIKRFSWEESAKQTYHIYEEILSRNKQ